MSRAPNLSGRQHLLVCRVISGVYTRGAEGMDVPPVRLQREAGRPYEIRYDMTVDCPCDPQIFVAYHDAQVYPDYLLTFDRPPRR